MLFIQHLRYTFYTNHKKSNYYQVFVEVEVKSGAQTAAKICGKNANPTKLLFRRIWYSIGKSGVLGVQEYLFTIKIDPCLGMRGGWFTGVFYPLKAPFTLGGIPAVSARRGTLPSACCVYIRRETGGKPLASCKWVGEFHWKQNILCCYFYFCRTTTMTTKKRQRRVGTRYTTLRTGMMSENSA